MKNIMIVEDDKMLNDGIAFNLQLDNFKILSAYNLKDAMYNFENNEIDMIILDVNLPDGSGLDFCKTIRNVSNVPVIFLTACDMEDDIINGLKIGADDYITKPFSINILRQRVETLFRRYNKVSINNILKINEFEFDFDKMIVSKNSNNIVLAPTEYKLLKKLVQCRGQVLTRQALIDELWENDDFIEEHALTVNINRLRSKIEDNSSKPKYIKTVYKIGYTFVGN